MQQVIAAQLSVEPAETFTAFDLERAITKLPKVQRSVILLVGLEGMSYGEVAAVVDEVDVDEGDGAVRAVIFANFFHLLRARLA